MITFFLFLSGIILVLWGASTIAEAKEVEDVNIAHNHKLSELNQRRSTLIDCYGDPSIVDRIINREFWAGQTAAQLEDSLGAPIEIDKFARKNTTREVWKYNKTGKNRFGLKITLVNYEVVDWDLKSNS